MLHDITGIEFVGAAFESKISLQLFSQKETERVSLIFGRNGSGKSTVSRAAIKAAGNDEIEDIISSRFVDLTNSSVVISDDEKKQVRVFNEDYTNAKVRFKENGLSTIVMFGDMVDIADKIETALANLKQAESDFEKQYEKFTLYTDGKNILSPENHYEKIKNKLKGSNSWADRERLIFDLKQNAQVNDAAISEITNSVPTRSQHDLSIAYESEYSSLQSAKNAGVLITTPLPSINDYSAQIKDILSLLPKKIELPILSVREMKLLDLAQSGKQSMLGDMKTEFSSKTTNCPFCLQSVSEEYKSELVRSIERVLSKDAEEHGKSLESCKIPNINLDITLFAPIDKKTLDSCRKTLDIVNNEITKCNNAIERKIENLFTPIVDFSSELIDSVDLLKVQFESLADKKSEYNELINHSGRSQQKLKVLNKELAYYEIIDSYADYISQKNARDLLKSELDSFETTLKKAKANLEQLNQQKTNVKIAVDLINKGLQYVFFSTDKIKVNVQGDNYILLSNNKPVKPKNISAGERNILALCYFFTELLKDVDEHEIHKSEYFIVLDDPVSSFDLENRIGIISYIKSQMLKVLRGNQNSKIAILSHDLMTIYDLDTTLDEIKHQIKIKSDKNDVEMTYRVLELDKRKLSTLKIGNRNEYSLLLKTVYEYAASKSNDYELVIGNIIRRMLEAFGTFEFRKGVSAISCDSTILSYIPENKREYFENLMYRLILHGDSHLEDRTKTITDYNFFATISPEEKKRTARDVLCLMYLLNGNHIKAQFIAMKDEVSNDAIGNIQGWVEVISAS